MDILTFWELTPYELSLKIKAYNQNKRVESDEKIAVAYLTAMWAAQWFGKKKPPALNKILKKEKEKVNKKMAPEEILEQVIKSNVAMGGTTY